MQNSLTWERNLNNVKMSKNLNDYQKLNDLI